MTHQTDYNLSAKMLEELTRNGLEAYLRKSQSAIYKFAQDKVLPGLKVEKHWRFRRN